MVTTTIGGLIKDYRIKKRLSQLDVAIRMDWKEPSRLSKIEQSRTSKPTRLTIDRLLTALDLNYQERGDFLYSGGYVPTEQEVKEAIKQVNNYIDNWAYPAYLVDFTWRWLYANDKILEAAKLTPDWKKKVEKLKPNLLEFPFYPKEAFPVEIFKGPDKDHLHPFMAAQLAAFKLENERFKNERWYRQLVQSLMKYPDFRELWPAVSSTMYAKKLFDYEYKILVSEYRGKKRALNFHVFASRVFSNPRFQVLLYYPANQETINFYK